MIQKTFPHFPVSHFPPMQFSAAFSTLATMTDTVLSLCLSVVECKKNLWCSFACIFADTQVPGIPGCPVVDKVDGNKVIIHWAAPESHGESKITHYIIHYGTEDMDLESFEKCRVTSRKTSCTISTRIRWNEKYRFAVAAENKQGVGLLSEFSEWIETPTRGGMHLLAWLCMMDLVILMLVKRLR